MLNVMYGVSGSDANNIRYRGLRAGVTYLTRKDQS